MGLPGAELHELLHDHFKAAGLREPGRLAEEFVRGGRAEVLGVVAEFWNTDGHDFLREVEDVLDSLTG